MAFSDWSTTAGSNTSVGGVSIAEGMNPSDVNNAIRAVMAEGRAALGTKGADIASATTTDLGAVAGLFHDITGTTTITGFGTIGAGIWKVIKFEDALTLTHNATSLILPGAANITTVAGDIAVVTSEGSGNWRCVSYLKASNKPWPPAGSILQTVSSGIIAGSSSTSSSAPGADVTSASLAITPSSASNKVLVMMTWAAISTLVTDTNTVYSANVFRDSTQLTTDGSDLTLSAAAASIGLSTQGSMSWIYLDSPNTTSEITYKLTHYATSGATVTSRKINITLQEIKG